MRKLLEEESRTGKLKVIIPLLNDYHRFVLGDDTAYPPYSMPLSAIEIMDERGHGAVPTVPFEVPQEMLGNKVTLTSRNYINFPTFSFTREEVLREDSGKEIKASYEIPLTHALLCTAITYFRPRQMFA